jgi:hypothetical protein
MEKLENSEADNRGESTFLESSTHPTLPVVRCTDDASEAEVKANEAERSPAKREA